MLAADIGYGRRHMTLALKYTLFALPLAGVLCVDRMYTRTLMLQETYAQYWGNKSIEEIWAEIEPERAP